MIGFAYGLAVEFEPGVSHEAVRLHANLYTAKEAMARKAFS
tara:strand:+ start:913 stop:1035 length:123 start_codon:yes stop_codon:yes gene_type:complete